MSTLVVCEKPSVARSVAEVLGATKKCTGYTEGNGYAVSWCYGHLVGLMFPDDYGDKWSGKWDFSQLPMIPKKWKFRITDSGKDQYKILKKLMNDSDISEIICATDADREGECIFRYVYNLSGSRKPVKRLWISSLEETVIRKGFDALKPSAAYDSLYSAGFSRAQADWLVGMNASRLFSCRFGNSLSIGRVQTPTLALIVNRDRQISDFVKQKYFTVDLILPDFKASSERIDSEDTACKLASACNNSHAEVKEIRNENKKINPPKLYDLTTLQREANRILGYTASQTLEYLQALYEGKLATYPRTNSQYLPDDMKDTAVQVISSARNIFPELFVSDSFDIDKCINNSKVESHHAIIPTVNIAGANINGLPEGQRNILILLCGKLLCAAGEQHTFNSCSVKVMFTVDEKDSAEFHKTLAVAHNRQIIINELSENNNLSAHQIALLENVITLTAEKNSFISLDNYLSADYTDEQLISLSEKISAFLNQSEQDQWLNKNDLFSDIVNTKSRYDQLLMLGSVAEGKDYSQEQITALLNAINQGLTETTLEQLDNTYTPDEINEYVSIFKSARISDLYTFIEEHRARVEVTEAVQDILFEETPDVSETEIVPEEVTEEPAARKFASVKEMLENIYAIASPSSISQEFSDGKTFLIREDDTERNPLNAVTSVQLSIGERVKPEEALHIINDISPATKITDVYAEVMDADYERSPAKRGHSLIRRLNPSEFASLYDYTLRAGKENNHDYSSLIADAEHVQQLTSDAHDTLIEYLNNPELIPCIIDKMFARDEMDDIYDEIHNGENTVSVARKKIDLGSHSITIPGTEKPEEHQFFPIGISEFVDVHETFTGISFTALDFTVEYNWGQIGSFLEKAANDYRQHEDAWAQLRQEFDGTVNPETEKKIRDAFSTVRESYTLTEKADDFLKAFENTLASRNKDYADINLMNGYPFNNNYGSAAYINNQMDGKLYEFTDKVNQLLSENHRDNAIETAKKLISEYCFDEFGDDADYSDLHSVGLAYTENDEGLPVQVTADLVDFKVYTELNNIRIKEEIFSSLEEMNEQYLSGLNFDEMIYTSTEDTMKALFTDQTVNFTIMSVNGDEYIVSGYIDEYTDLSEYIDFNEYNEEISVQYDYCSLGDIGESDSASEEQIRFIRENLSYVQDNDSFQILESSEFSTVNPLYAEHEEELSETEPEPVQNTESKFRIYQLKDGEEYHYARFSDYESNKHLNLNYSDYELKYEDNFDRIKNTINPLDEIFTRFNIDRPDDFTGHSLSVSDVIVVEKDGEITAHYVDDYGFTDMPEFFTEKELTAEITPEIIPGYIEKYDLDLDFRNFTSVVLETDEEIYEGGIDSDGHERKDNYSHEINTTSYYLQDNILMKTEEGEFPVQVTLQEALDEISLFLDKSLDDSSYNAFIKENDGSMTHLNASVLIENAKYKAEKNNPEILSPVGTKTDEAPGLDADSDKPMFAEAYSEDFEKPEPSETNDTPANESYTQMSLFGENDSPSSGKTVKRKSSLPEFIEGIPAEKLLETEVMRGSGFEDGKFRINDYYKNNHPSMEEFKKFLKDEYGKGGHSASSDMKPVSFVDHDSKGLTFQFEGGNKYTVNWTETAGKIAELIDADKYITQKDIERRISHYRFVLDNTSPNDMWGKSQIDKAKEILQSYGALDDDTVIISYAQAYHMNAHGYNVDGINCSLSLADREKTFFVKEADFEEFRAEKQESLKHFLPAKMDMAKMMTDNGLDVTNTDDVKKMIYIHDIALAVKQINSEFEGVPEDLELNHDLDLTRYPYNFGWDDYDTSLDTYFNTQNTLFSNNTEPVRNYLKEVMHKSDVDILTYLKAQNLVDYIDSFEEIYKSNIKVMHNEQSLTSEDKASESNFRIENDNLGEGGPKEKFRNNAEAIRTLKQIETEKRPATDAEKDTLSKYVGWGGLPMAFDKNNDAWTKEYTELKDLLTDSEYRSAMASTLDAFYTSPVIIDNIYTALRNFGYEGGNLLEPACGVGNFIGCMPEDMAQNTKTYGVEIDSISGRIAQTLYPEADIQIKGFEKTKFSDGCFDVAIGNVPFGETNLTYKDQSLKIHDYFFAQTLDKVKDGGIVAFVTSTGTLDKKSESFREELAKKADLIGAIRLPSGAFKANAGTSVTSDIIFLQKRSEPSAELPDWVHISENENGLPVNSYFKENPDMILGTLTEDTNPFSSGTKVAAHENSDLGTELSEAVSKLEAVISYDKANEVYPEKEPGAIEAPEDLKNYSFFMSDDKVYFKESDDICKFKYDKDNNIHERAKAFIELRDTTRELLTAQEQNQSDEVIKSLQNRLNDQYDSFYKNYGLLHSKTNKKYFSEDIAYNLTLSLEKSFDKDKLTEKSDIFTKRTIKPAEPITHVDTAMEALALSVAEKAEVNFDYMTELTGLTKPELLGELHGEIFQIPYHVGEYQTANEYLSGDIRQKLNIARSALDDYPQFSENIAALEAVMPEPLKAGDIDVKIGAAWIDPKIYDKFMYETFDTPYQYRNDVKHSFWDRNTKRIDTEYCSETATYYINNKKEDKSVNVTKNFGSKDISAYEIMESLLNLKDPKISRKVEDPVTGKERYEVDIEATKVAQRKADKIKKAFSEWIFKDPERRDALVEKYNELFNSIRPREYDGSNLKFPNMNAEIQLHDHQKNAIAHAMFGGNTLFAHSVGAGKTFEMIATAMESKRLGLCTKSLFVVPNHLTEQIGADFQKLYPSANVLVATKNDFKKENRQQLFAKIATGNFDAVVIGHSQLKMIPLSVERQEKLLRKQIDDVTQGIAALKESNGSQFQIKQLERTKRALEEQLAKLQVKNQDNTVTFEEMGIDKLFVDEAHEFKNLATFTKLQNVSGLSTTASQKAMDLFMKCQYLDEKTGGKGVVFATGTPLSNSVTELHTMMRYLEYDFLNQKCLSNFDNWVTVFGSQKTDWELAPAGNKFKQRTRIANYSGLPELMSMFKQIADVRTADTLKLDVPECEMHVVNVEPTEFQKVLVQELADRADDVQERKVDPSYDNMLRITSDGRKLGLDPRLIDPSFEDNPGTKLNMCVENVVKIHTETAQDKLTQIIFCDLGVPHKASSAAENEKDNDEKSVAEKESFEEECDFCIYDDIRKKLIDKGIPENEIAFIHDAKTEKQKTDLFEKVRTGEIRVLLGSTPKMGTGTNVQDRLIAQHDLDIPWRPADMEQRLGRMVRQGNQNNKVHLYRYVTKGTFDSYSYQTLECKQKFISQIMTSKTPVRKCEDVDQQALSYGEIKALCTGDERIKEKMQLDNEVKELRILKAEYTNTLYDMQDKVRNAPLQEAKLVNSIAGMRADMEKIRQLPVDEETKLPAFSITVGSETYTDKTEAAKILEGAVFGKLMANMNSSVPIGKFQGFDLSVYMDSFTKTIHATLKGESAYTVEFGTSYAHNLKKLEGALYRIDSVIAGAESKLNQLRVDTAEAQKIVNTPFAYETELTAKSERLDTLTDELNRAAMEAKANNPDKERTAYFDRAKLKKEAAKAKKQEQKNTPAKDDPQK